jgi:hypothetical protein
MVTIKMAKGESALVAQSGVQLKELMASSPA